MKHILSLLFALLLCTSSYAQRYDHYPYKPLYPDFDTPYHHAVPTRDVVYLKNGSVIRGIVIEMTTNGNTRIRTADGSILVYPSSEVTRIEKEKCGGAYSRLRQLRKDYELHSDSTQRKLGYSGSVESGFGCLFSDGDLNGALLTTHGSIVTPHLYLGGGFGFDSNYGVIFGDVRTYLKSWKAHFDPYFECKLGYCWYRETWDGGLGYSYFNYTETSGGLYISPSLGFALPFGHHKAAFLVSAVYSMYLNSGESDHGIALRFGFAF